MKRLTVLSLLALLSRPAVTASGGFPEAYFAPGFVGPATRSFQQQFIAVMQDSTQSNFKTFLQALYPAGSSAPSSGKPGGAQARLKMAVGPVDDATLAYAIRIPQGFDFVKGGKLPGLCGGACYTGANNGPLGWAGRFMWRAKGAGEVLVNDATTTGYGSDLGLGSWYWPADGQWHIISQHVTMNTPGKADGVIDVQLDLRQVAHITGITFRVNNTVHIDSLMFSTFFGGHDSTWAPPTDTTIDFANFIVIAGRGVPPPPPSPNPSPNPSPSPAPTPGDDDAAVDLTKHRHHRHHHKESAPTPGVVGTAADTTTGQ